MLHVGDCREVLGTFPDESVDAVVTDPPYELGFMGKAWDASGVAYDVALWRQVLRVLKPGGHLLAFGGSRTYHRLACAIEDAGFEIRDQIQWLYGSGFPKSLNVSKAIDKAAGAEREVVGIRAQSPKFDANRSGGTNTGYNRRLEEGAPATFDITAPATDDAKRWEGWGTALKPAHEPIVVARKPLAGTVVETVLAYGTGALNIDDCRVGETPTNPATRRYTSGGFEHLIVEGVLQNVAPSTLGRWPANVIHDGSDEVLELFPETRGGSFPQQRGQGRATDFGVGQPTEGGARRMGDEGSAARFFYCAKPSRAEREAGLDEFEPQRSADRIADDLPGGDNPRNRSNTARANHHPTVKPIALMRYLVRLVTPPGGTVLDPFTGSGTTGIAARLEGFGFVGIEQSADYATIAEARIAAAA
jgi:DNA modification methylase